MCYSVTVSLVYIAPKWPRMRNSFRSSSKDNVLFLIILLLDDVRIVQIDVGKQAAELVFCQLHTVLLAVIYAGQQFPAVYRCVTMKCYSHHSIFDLHGEGERFLPHITMVTLPCSVHIILQDFKRFNSSFL